MTVSHMEGIWGNWTNVICPDDGIDNTTTAEKTPIFITVVWGLTVFIAVTYAVVTVLKFNSVDVFGKKKRTTHISNNFWIIYFLMAALRSCIDALRFDFHASSFYTEGDIFDAYMIVDAIAMCSLLYALNFQRKHRSRKSSIEEKPRGGQINDGGTQTRCSPNKDRYVSDVIIAAVFVGYIGVAIASFAIPVSQSNVSIALRWVLFGFVVLSRALILLNGLYIATKMHRLCRRTTGDVADDGPTMGTRICVLVGVILSVIIDLPPSIWTLALPNSCVFYIATPYDVLQLLQILVLSLYFIVVRNEFKRNMEECIWTTVSMIQDSWDFANF